MKKEKLLFLLQEAYENKNSVVIEELIDDNVFLLESSLFSNILCQLLEAEWHEKHEDIALLLEGIMDEKSINSLFIAAQKKFSYLEYDNSIALARKCIWALWRIRTDEAIYRIKLLAECSDEEVRALAIKQLSRLGMRT